MGRPSEAGAGLGRLARTLGPTGLMVAALAVLAGALGAVVLVRESGRQREATRDTLRLVLARWVRRNSSDYLGRSLLADVVARWRTASARGGPAAEDPGREVREALEALGASFEEQAERTPGIEVVAMDLGEPGRPPLASWRSRRETRATAVARPPEVVPLVEPAAGAPGVDLTVRYRVSPEIEAGLGRVERSFRRMLTALLGLSGFTVLCLAYLVRHEASLRDRAAREAAQEATLDLADRTCHELGNVVFVLANERRNLDDLLDLVARVVSEGPALLEAAARRAGLGDDQVHALERAYRREAAARGLDPDADLADSLAIAREVCRQIATSSRYVAFTVRELDGYLKRSALPVAPGPVPFSAAVDEALALLGPRLESSGAVVERPEAEVTPLADHRLLVHALVNLFKNAIEAAASAGRPLRLTIGAEADGPVVRVSVADNGPGLPEASRARPFDRGVSTKGPGRGRGLAIVRDSIRAMGGTIEGSSRPGGGAIFRITLPVGGPNRTGSS